MNHFKVFFLLCLANFSIAFECGVTKFGIGFSVGGEYSNPGQWPWLGSLFYNQTYFCGSSIISKKHLLSAAHCIQPKDEHQQLPTDLFYAFLGRYNLEHENDTNSLKVEFSEIFVHRDWNAAVKSFDGDIALLLMKSEIDFTEFIQPICLPTASSKVFDVGGTVAGYGLTESSDQHETRPKHIDIRSFVSNIKCNKTSPKFFTSIASERMFCAGMHGQNPCRGDSGGPFMVNANNHWTVVGIVSVAAKINCNDNNFVIFTQVPKFITWIKDIVDECGRIRVIKDSDGNSSYPGQWPWLVPIFRQGSFACSSSIISKSTLLSTANCAHPKDEQYPFPSSDFYAFPGLVDLNNIEDKNLMKVEFSRILTHWHWNATIANYDGDIALFFIKSNLEFNDYIQPICLPSANAKFIDVEGTALRFGNSESSELKQIKLNTFEHRVCLSLHKNVKKLLSTTRMVCAKANETNLCGETGSLFMVQVNKQWTLNGIMSTALNQDCNERTFEMFTQVSQFLGWIKDYTDGHELECNYVWEFSGGDLVLTCKSSTINIVRPNVKIKSVTSANSHPLSFSHPLSEVTEVSISHALLYYLPDFSHLREKFPNFDKLKIDSSFLKELDRSKFALLPQLKRLVIINNQVEKLPEHVFDDLINLEVLILNLVGVAFTQSPLPQKLLWNLPQLKELSAFANGFDECPPRFFEKNTNIESINLGFNNLSQIDVDFRLMPKLKTFDLRWNKCLDLIFNIDENVYYEGQITDISLLQRTIQNSCTKQQDLSHIRCSFDIQDDKVICITFGFLVFERDVKVSSIQGQFTEFSELFSFVNTIRIEGTTVNYLPDFTLANTILPNFKSLYIISSNLMELNKTMLTLLPQLNELDVGNNLINEISEDVFDDLIHLEKLWIYNNKIKVLPQKILTSLPKLKLFAAQNNQIQNVPKNFFDANKNLETIDLQSNKIIHIEFDFKMHPNLKWFSLQNNVCVDNFLFNINNGYGQENTFKVHAYVQLFQILINEQCLSGNNDKQVQAVSSNVFHRDDELSLALSYNKKNI